MPRRRSADSPIMSDRKAVLKNADMAEDMQQDAIDCATQVCFLESVAQPPTTRAATTPPHPPTLLPPPCRDRMVWPGGLAIVGVGRGADGHGISRLFGWLVHSVLVPTLTTPAPPPHHRARARARAPPSRAHPTAAHRRHLAPGPIARQTVIRSAVTHTNTRWVRNCKLCCPSSYQSQSRSHPSTSVTCPALPGPVLRRLHRHSRSSTLRRILPRSSRRSSTKSQFISVVPRASSYLPPALRSPDTSCAVRFANLGSPAAMMLISRASGSLSIS